MNRLDAEQAKTEIGAFRLCSHQYDSSHPPSDERAALMDRLNSKLKEYDDLLLREHAIMSVAPPTEKAYLTYFDYIWNERPLVDSELAFIHHKSDLVSLGELEDSWLGSIVEGLSSLTPKMVLKVFTTVAKKSLISAESGQSFYLPQKRST